MGDSMGVETLLPGRMSACLGPSAADPHGAEEACVGGVKRESPGKGLGPTSGAGKAPDACSRTHVVGKVQSEAAGPTAATAQQRGRGEPCRPRVGRTRLDPGWSHPRPRVPRSERSWANGCWAHEWWEQSCSLRDSDRCMLPLLWFPAIGRGGTAQDKGSEDQPRGTVRSSGRTKNSLPGRLRPRAAVPAAGSKGARTRTGADGSVIWERGLQGVRTDGRHRRSGDLRISSPRAKLRTDSGLLFLLPQRRAVVKAQLSERITRDRHCRHRPGCEEPVSLDSITCVLCAPQEGRTPPPPPPTPTRSWLKTAPAWGRNPVAVPSLPGPPTAHGRSELRSRTPAHGPHLEARSVLRLVTRRSGYLPSVTAALMRRNVYTKSYLHVTCPG